MQRRGVFEEHGVGGLECGRGLRRGLMWRRGWKGEGFVRGDASGLRRGGVFFSCGRGALGIER